MHRGARRSLLHATVFEEELLEKERTKKKHFNVKYVSGPNQRNRLWHPERSVIIIPRKAPLMTWKH